LHISPNTSQNKDILDKKNAKKNMNNLDVSSNEEIPGEVEIVNEKIEKT